MRQHGIVHVHTASGQTTELLSVCKWLRVIEMVEWPLICSIPDIQQFNELISCAPFSNVLDDCVHSSYLFIYSEHRAKDPSFAIPRRFCWHCHTSHIPTKSSQTISKIPTFKKKKKKISTKNAIDINTQNCEHKSLPQPAYQKLFVLLQKIVGP